MSSNIHLTDAALDDVRAAGPLARALLAIVQELSLPSAGSPMREKIEGRVDGQHPAPIYWRRAVRYEDAEEFLSYSAGSGDDADQPTNYVFQYRSATKVDRRKFNITSADLSEAFIVMRVFPINGRGREVLQIFGAGSPRAVRHFGMAKPNSEET